MPHVAGTDPVHDSSGQQGATTALPAQQGAMPSAGASHGIFQGLPFLLKTRLVSIMSKQPSALLSQPPSSSATHVRRLFQWEGFHLFIY